MGARNSHLLNLQGKDKLCRELRKQGYCASIVYDSASPNVYVSKSPDTPKKLLKVKVTQYGRIVTNMSRKNITPTKTDSDEIWVLIDLDNSNYYIMYLNTLIKEQTIRNNKYAKDYKLRHGIEPNASEGVDNILLKDLKAYQNNWNIIKKTL